MAGEIISRSDSAALIPEVVANGILQKAATQSAALGLFRQVRMSTSQTRMPCIAALPMAYFVNGDTGQKGLSEQAWTNKFLNAEELATIVPIPEAVLDDADFDVWGEVRPRIEEAIGRALDAAIFFGTNKPSSWPAAIFTDIAAKSHKVNRGTNAAAAGGLAGDISDAMALIENDGYDPSGIIANRATRGRLRQNRTTLGEGQPDVTQTSAYGTAITYPMRGMWPAGSQNPELIVGDFNEGMIGLRQDITYKVLDQAVLQNPDGSIAFNLAQQDMVALRCVFRVGFQVANVLNLDNSDENTRYPWAAVVTP